MANLKFNKTIISKIESTITGLIREEITRQDLIDTGNMIRSIKTTAKVSSNNFTFSVEAVDYFKYIDGDYNIVSNVMKGGGYTLVEGLIQELYVDALENSLE